MDSLQGNGAGGGEGGAGGAGGGRGRGLEAVDNTNSCPFSKPPEEESSENG